MIGGSEEKERKSLSLKKARPRKRRAVIADQEDVVILQSFIGGRG